jgi:hypothetical protein
MHFREHQQVARVLLTWPTRPVLGQALAALILDRLQCVDASPTLIPLEIAARQIADAQLVLVVCWVPGRPVCDVDAIAQALKAAAASARRCRPPMEMTCN